LSALEWALSSEKLEVPPAALAKIAELADSAPRPSPRLRAAAKRPRRMSEQEPTYIATPVEEADVRSGFSCGNRPLDDYFARHALANDRRGPAEGVPRAAGGEDLRDDDELSSEVTRRFSLWGLRRSR
jgi:hypothetical protein